MAESLTQEEASKSPKLLVAAIDFGTVYSGYAYSFKYEWTKVKINNWGGGENLSYKIILSQCSSSQPRSVL